MEFKIKTLDDLKNFSIFIKNNYCNEQIFLLKGPLGIGKTQLIKFLLNINSVTSPTFNLLNNYNNENHIYFHFDLYKKDKVFFWQLEELGFNELFENINNKCFIEWPERLDFSLEGVEIIFSYNNDNNEDRVINITRKGDFCEPTKKI